MRPTSNPRQLPRVGLCSNWARTAVITVAVTERYSLYAPVEHCFGPPMDRRRGSRLTNDHRLADDLAVDQRLHRFGHRRQREASPEARFEFALRGQLKQRFAV